MRYRNRRKVKRRHSFGWGVLLATGLMAAYGFVSYRQALPALAADSASVTPQSITNANAPWPSYGQAALGVSGTNTVVTHGEQKTVPTASVTKVMVALSVLREKPLYGGQQGPIITLTQADVTSFHQYLAKNGSVIQVKAGEKITERQALEAMLLPSANNMADTLAKWAFGSLENYSTYANNLAREIGLTNSRFGSADASGFSPETMSTARDLVKLGEAALDDPVLAQIVSEQHAKIPVADVILNGNWRLGRDGFNGIKTGSTDQAGGVYLFSAKQTLSTGQQVMVVGAIMGAPTLPRAITDAGPLMQSAAANFKQATVVKAGQKVAQYQIPWGGEVAAVATKSAHAITWKGQSSAPKIILDPIKTPTSKGDQIGTITLSGGTTIPVIASKAITAPSWQWRALRNL